MRYQKCMIPNVAKLQYHAGQNWSCNSRAYSSQNLKVCLLFSTCNEGGAVSGTVADTRYKPSITAGGLDMLLWPTFTHPKKWMIDQLLWPTFTHPKKWMIDQLLWPTFTHPIKWMIVG